MANNLPKKSIKIVVFIALSFFIILWWPSKSTYAYESEGLDYSSVFDASYYYENNSDVAAVYGMDEDALWQHFLNYGMAEGRQASEQFNPVIYKSIYQDLYKAYGDNMSAYYTHYIVYGISEGRIGNYTMTDLEPVFNAQNYMNRNLDIRVEYGDDTYSAFIQFLTYGISEERQANNLFDLRAYKAANADLRAEYGDDNMAYIIHYLNYGQYEGRVTTDKYSVSCGNDNMETTYAPVFDADYYASHNSDVVAIYGTDETALLKHFIAYGMKEGRQASKSFNVSYYRTNNSDLQAAYGNDLQSYYLHYIRYGVSEGRKGSASTDTLNPLTYTGIDVSTYQGDIDWEAVLADPQNIGFAIIRVGYGDNDTSQDDKRAAQNISECERLGIPYGVYLYSYATNTTEADSEIQHLLRMLDGHNPTMGVYIDIEDTSYYSKHGIDVYSDSGRTLITSLTSRILNGISNAGYTAGVYANVNYFKNVLYADQLSGYRWIAGYGDYEETCKQLGAVIWQYSSSGTVNGISGYVDMDYYFGVL